MIAVCVKWVDLHPDLDPLTGAVTTDERRHGFSAADQAALEVGLRLAGERSTGVVLVCAGPAAAEAALLDLAASGVSSVLRLDAADGSGSDAVGASIAAALPAGVDLVLTGDYSLDRGSGSVPSFVAHHLGWAQALGLIAVGSGSPLPVIRRLDGGRREHLQLDGPAVVSVEGSVARLRRASLPDVLRARRLDVVVRAGVPEGSTVHVGPPSPVRPRARVLPAPAGARALDRIVDLTGAMVERTPPRRVEADGPTAAAEIVAQLRAWGYLD